MGRRGARLGKAVQGGPRNQVGAGTKGGVLAGEGETRVGGGVCARSGERAEGAQVAGRREIGGDAAWPLAGKVCART